MSPEQKSGGIKSHRMSEKSILFDRIIPILFIVLALALALLIVFAIGVLTGLVHWA